MKFEIIFLIVIHLCYIESRTAWVYSLKEARSNEVHNATLKPPSAVNVSSSDIKTFVKVLNILRKQLESDVKSQYEQKNLKRTLTECTDLERENEQEVGIILPIPNPLEDLTLLSLLYDDTANWSKCTRSCKSQRVRKCRARGLCSLDYLIEEAFCFFPDSKCEKKVRKLIDELVSRNKSIGHDEDDRKAPENGDEYQYDYEEHASHSHEDYDHNHEDHYEHNHEEENEHNHEEDYEHNHEEDYEHNHEEDYEHNHEEHYEHNHEVINNHNYDYFHGDYHTSNDDDFPTNEGKNYENNWQYMDENFDPNSFWENDDYSYGDPNTFYDCHGCEYDHYDEKRNESDYDGGDENDDDDDKTCGNTVAGVPKRSFRIIGGQRAVKGAWPWQVAIVDKYGVNFCAGTIIAPRWVLTAAHCAKKGIRVRIAEHDVSRYDGEVEIKVRKSYIHPQFDSETFDCDIALLKLPKNVLRIGKSSAKKACLPQKTSKLPKQKSCVVLGWGLERESHIYGSDILMYAKVPIVSDRKCYDAYSDFYMTKHMFCAGFLRGGPDTCSGDSGGPLLCQDEDKRWVLHGVTSFGEGCGERGRFGVYTKVKNFLYWINKTINA